MVVLESLACGTPALVSDIGGPKNIVMDGATGYVLSTTSPEIWTEKLKEIIPLIHGNDSRYVSLSDESRQHVIKTFDVNRILDNYIVNNDHFEESPIVENVLRVVG